jgi:endonuclease YncB( thermonuclease family)
MFLKRMHLTRTRSGRKILAFLLMAGISAVFGAQQWSWRDFVDVMGKDFERFSVLFSARDDQSQNGFVRVKRVVDGDTIELDDSEKVRYIGINSPESVKVNSPVECFGKAASAKNAELVEGKRVRLEKDVSDRDRYGRLLRFVYLEDGTFVNETLVREGYAYASPYTPDVSKSEFFKQAEREARENRHGLWAPDTCNGKK